MSIKRARGTAAQFYTMQRLTGSTPSEGHHDRIEGVKFRQGSLQVNAFSLSAVVFMVLMNFFSKNHILCHNVWFHFTGQTLLTSIFSLFYPQLNKDNLICCNLLPEKKFSRITHNSQSTHLLQFNKNCFLYEDQKREAALLL